MGRISDLDITLTLANGAAIDASAASLAIIDDSSTTIGTTDLTRVAIFDASDTQITSFGGGTQYTEDAAAAADPVGNATILIRADTPAGITSTDGDNIAQRGTDYGAAYVQVVDSAGAFVDTFGGGTQYIEGATDASITGTALMLEAAADTLIAAPGTVADGMLVNLGTNNDVTVTGTITANAGTGTLAVSAASLPLPSGAATSALQTSSEALLTTISTPVATISATPLQRVAIFDAADAQITTFGGGTEYTESATDASITGTAMLMEGAADTLLPVQGTVADGLLVNLGANNDVTLASTTITGTVEVTKSGTWDITNAGTFLVQSAQSGAWNITNISGTVSLPTGASTAAKQPALGTAGTASSDVLSVQGIAAMTPLLVNGSAVTQPVSGTFWQATQPVSGTVSVTGVATETTLASLLTSSQLIDDSAATIGTTALTRVAIFDAADAQITTFGGGTQYTEDAAAAADPVGNATILIRADTPGAITTTNGDNVAQRGTDYGAAYVQVVDSAGAFVDTFGGGTQYTEAATDASITGTAMLMEGAADTLLPVQGTVADGLLVNLGSNNDVTLASTTITGSVAVTGTFWQGTQPVSGTVAVTGVATEATLASLLTSSQLIDDAVQVLGTDVYTEATSKGITLGAVRRDADTTLVNTTNEFGPLQMDANGRLKVEAFSGEALPVTLTSTTIAGTVAATQSGTWNIGSITTLPTLANVTTLGTITNTVTVGGIAAHDAAASGNPQLVSGVAQNTDDTAPPNRVSAEGDATRLATDFDGSVFVRPHGPQVWSYHLDTSTAQTDTSVHAAPGAGLSLYVGTIVFSSGAATAINMFLEEGASTVLGPFYLEAIAGRGMAVTFNPPKKITANTALTLTTSASIAHSVDITGFTAQG